MKVNSIAVFFLVAVSAVAQISRAQLPSARCTQTAKEATEAVRTFIFYDDPIYKEKNVVGIDSFLRLSIFPRWSADEFYQIRLVNAPNEEKSVIVKYSIPMKAHSLRSLVETALEAKPCASVGEIAVSLPIKRTTIPVRKEWRATLDKVHQLEVHARPYSDEVWLDTTVFELEYVGANTIRYRSDNPHDPVVEWIDSVVKIIDSGS